MVKIIKSFHFLTSLPVVDDGPFVDLRIDVRRITMSTGPCPFIAGRYVLHRIDGIPDVSYDVVRVLSLQTKQEIQPDGVLLGTIKNLAAAQFIHQLFNKPNKK